MVSYVIFMYIHNVSVGQEKGTTPLHVAAKAGQLSQAELLVVYGADPGAEDSQGKTPVDYARCDLKFVSN
jgi:ankyrin repeat protein